eukprot:6180811-Pleurochrysis_carterae.AAC.1
MFVKEHVQMVAKADFDLVLHHGHLLDASQVDIQVRHKHCVGELDDCAAGRNNDDIALASGDDEQDTLLSGLHHRIGLGGHAKRKPAYVVEHMCWSHLESMYSTTCPSSCAKSGEVAGAGQRCSRSRP